MVRNGPADSPILSVAQDATHIGEELVDFPQLLLLPVKHLLGVLDIELLFALDVERPGAYQPACPPVLHTHTSGGMPGM
jgi:hypothetical protein